MATVAPEIPISSPSNALGEAFTLRITGGGLDGRLVRLSSAKCTVGSGPRCTLRLVGPGIRPLHCMVVRGVRGTFVRRWSPDTFLNGRSFEDAILQLGDRLRIGPLDLEVVQGSEAEDAPSTASIEACPVRPAVAVDRETQVSDPTSLVPADAHRSATPDESLAKQITHLRQRARNMVDALRESRSLQQEMESRVEASLSAQREAEARLRQIASNAQEADRRAEDLRREIERLEQEAAESSQQTDPNHQARIASLSEDLKAANQTLADERDQAEAAQRECDAMRTEVRDYEQRNSELSRQLDTLREEVQELRQNLEREREQVALERESWSTPEAAAESELQFLQKETDQPSGTDDHLEAADAQSRESLGSEPNSLEEMFAAPPVQPRPKTGDAPVSFIERYAAQFADEEEREPRPAFPEASSTHTTDPEPDSSSAGPADDSVEDFDGDGDSPAVEQAATSEEDESLEDYMAKLMQRVRGEGSSSQAPARPSSTPAKVQAAAPQPDSLTAEKEVAGKPKSGVFQLEQMKRTGALPERVGNFAAMRELANLSAHRAISRYKAECTMRDAVGKLISSIVCAGSGVAIILLAPELASAAFVGGMAALLVSGYFALRGTWSLVANIRNRRGGRGKSVALTPKGKKEAEPAQSPTAIEPAPSLHDNSGARPPSLNTPTEDDGQQEDKRGLSLEAELRRLREG